MTLINLILWQKRVMLTISKNYNYSLTFLWLWQFSINFPDFSIKLLFPDISLISRWVANLYSNDVSKDENASPTSPPGHQLIFLVETCKACYNHMTYIDTKHIKEKAVSFDWFISWRPCAPQPIEIRPIAREWNCRYSTNTGILLWSNQHFYRLQIWE